MVAVGITNEAVQDKNTSPTVQVTHRNFANRLPIVLLTFFAVVIFDQKTSYQTGIYEAVAQIGNSNGTKETKDREPWR